MSGQTTNLSLEGIEFYNPRNVPELVQYAKESAFGDENSFKYFQSLLLIYKLNPGVVGNDISVIAILLLKAICSPNESDFDILVSLLCDDQMKNNFVAEAISFGRLFRSCRYQQLWKSIEKASEITTLSVWNDFIAACRRQVALNLGFTFHTVQFSILMEELGLDSEQEVIDCIKDLGWSYDKDNQFATVPNFEFPVKMKKPVENTTFADVLNMMHKVSSI